MNKRLQTILETVENLMDQSEYDVNRTEYDSRLVVRRPPPKKNTPSTYGQRPSTEAPTGLFGAGSSVSGYDSRPKTGGLLGAGSSVSGYDSGSDAPTPQPPSNKPPYPRLPPSRRPGSPDNPFSKIPGGYDGFGKPKSPKGDDNYGPFQGKDSWRDRDEWVVDKEIQTYPPKYVYRRKTDADWIGDRFGSINRYRFRSIM